MCISHPLIVYVVPLMDRLAKPAHMREMTIFMSMLGICSSQNKKFEKKTVGCDLVIEPFPFLKFYLITHNARV